MNNRMNNVHFTGKCAIDSESFNLVAEMYINDEKTVCSITIEALQDVNPATRTLDPEKMFQANKQQLVQVAIDMLARGSQHPLRISTANIQDWRNGTITRHD